METAKKLMPCYVMVVAPGATTPAYARAYRPFDKRTLAELFEAAAKKAQSSAGLHGRLAYDYYDIDESYFFGKPLTQEIAAQLEQVPSAIIDCSVHETETEATVDVTNALMAFYTKGAKAIYKIVRKDACPGILHPGQIITSEDELVNVLDAHLWFHGFRNLAKDHPL